jgi:hypothetical protein
MVVAPDVSVVAVRSSDEPSPSPVSRKRRRRTSQRPLDFDASTILLEDADDIGEGGNYVAEFSAVASERTKKARQQQQQQQQQEVSLVVLVDDDLPTLPAHDTFECMSVARTPYGSAVVLGVIRDRKGCPLVSRSRLLTAFPLAHHRPLLFAAVSRAPSVRPRLPAAPVPVAPASHAIVHLPLGSGDVLGSV